MVGVPFELGILTGANIASPQQVLSGGPMVSSTPSRSPRVRIEASQGVAVTSTAVQCLASLTLLRSSGLAEGIPLTAIARTPLARRSVRRTTAQARLRR